MIYSYSYAWSHKTQTSNHPKIWIMFVVPAILMNLFDINTTIKSVKRIMNEINIKLNSKVEKIKQVEIDKIQQIDKSIIFI